MAHKLTEFEINQIIIEEAKALVEQEKLNEIFPFVPIAAAAAVGFGSLFAAGAAAAAAAGGTFTIGGAVLAGATVVFSPSGSYIDTPDGKRQTLTSSKGVYDLKMWVPRDQKNCFQGQA